MKRNLEAMTVDELIQLRDQTEEALRRRKEELRDQLSRLTDADERRSRTGKPRSAMKQPRALKKKRKGNRSKVAPKYRGPKGETWSGRGLMPRWMTAAIETGASREEFLIS